MLLLALGLSRPAEACSLIGHQEFLPDAGIEDDQPPGQPGLEGYTVKRGVGPEGVFVHSATSCDDIGLVSVTLLPPEDDLSPWDALGYQLGLGAGEPPEDFALPYTESGFIQPLDGDGLLLVWIDGASDEQEAFDFELEVSAVDEAGNVGEPLIIALSDPGSRGGCSSVGLAGSWLLGLLALGLRRR